MTGAGDRAAQSVGIGLGALRPVRCLDGMDVKVDGAGMVRVAGQHALQVGTIGTLCGLGSRPPGFQ